MSGLVVPSTFRSVTGLGEPTRVYLRRRRSKGCGLIVCIVWLFLALGTGYCSLTVYSDAFSDSSDLAVLLVFGLANLFVLLGVVFWAWWTLSRWNEAAVVYRDGLAYFDGRKMHTVTWNEVASIVISVVRHYLFDVTLGLPMGTDREYTITSETGDRLKLGDSLSNVEELSERIRREVFPHILARARQAFDSGQPVQFGPLSISKTHGMRKGKRCYAWRDIAEISMARGWIWIKLRADDRFSSVQAPVSKIPNVDVFLTISTSMVD